MSVTSASNTTARRASTETYNAARRTLTMSSSARSTFESMAFHSSTLVHAPATTQTAGRVYGCVQNFHPTGNEKHSVDASFHERVYKTLFTKEHLFEVAVMYLFNGLKPTGASGARGRPKAGTLELLHYLAYIVPEADKLHVTDLNGHPEHIDRMEHVRVIFDPDDFRFRVIVKRKSGVGWIDISLQLRNTFIRQQTEVSGNLPDLWVTLVKELRSSLVAALVARTKCSQDRVSKWLTAEEDIAWEVPTYGADATGVRNLFADMDAGHKTERERVNPDGPPPQPSLQERAPFIVSYWADNYLQMDSYKVARVFNGLVGYGEFLYDRGNNYTKADVNNFFIGDVSTPGGKTWLWADMPYGDTHGPVGGNGTGPEHHVASLKERTRVLEAFIRGDKLYLAAGFRKIVARRHSSTMQALQGALVEALHGAIEVETAVATFVQQFDPFMENNQVADDPNDGKSILAADEARDGHLQSDVIFRTHNALKSKLEPHVAKYTQWEHGPVHDSMYALISASIHIARETWLLDKHTREMEEADLEAIQRTYDTGFWDSINESEEPYEALRTARPVVRGMKNNSNLYHPYMDPALSTYAVGYATAAREAGLVCDSFWYRVAPSVAQRYSDRKTNTDSRGDYIGNVDLTSLLRTTNSLVRTFDGFMRAMKPKETLLQTTRTMFAAHGGYFVLQGGTGVYGNLAYSTGGKRLLHVDDLVTFSFALCTMVDNPGIWNLLTAGRNSAAFEAKVANNGFVVSGYPVWDNTDRPEEASWGNVADMTFKKLQVGISRLPDNLNKAREYTQEVINNTRRTSASSAQHSFESFTRGVYNSEAYKRSLGETTTTAGPLRAALVEELVKQGSRFVGQLCACCRDAGLQVSKPGDADYAFSALRDLGIQLPTDPGEEGARAQTPDVRYKCLFYILYGETIARWMADVGGMQPATAHEQQRVQQKNHEAASHKYQQQLEFFLGTLTDKFFSGELYGALSSTLQARFPAGQQARAHAASAPASGRKLPAPTDADIAADMDAVVTRTRNLPNSHTHSIDDYSWRKMPPSAKQVKDEVRYMLWRVPALEAFRDDQADLRYVEEAARLHRGAGADNTAVATPVAESQELERLAAEAAAEDEREDLRHAQQVFGPYLDVYKQVVAFHLTSDANKPEKWKAPVEPALKHKDHSEQTLHFFENRMLVMAVCEEQMHLIQRHHAVQDDYGGSIAWCLLFSRFMYYRQAFAEMY